MPGRAARHGFGKTGLLVLAACLVLAMGMPALLSGRSANLPLCVRDWIGQGYAKAVSALIAEGNFESVADGNALRGREKEGGWYESRNIGGDKNARLQLKMHTKALGKNATKKAMIAGSPQFNTYLTQAFGEPQKGRFSLQWDIRVNEVLPPFNRSAFQMIGNAAAKGRGPNGSNPERFVFLGFESGPDEKINLFAFEGKNADDWAVRTPLITGLELNTWYTVRVDVDVAGKSYQVSMPGVADTPVKVDAFRVKKSNPPATLTHISFASWDDGPGTFYIDNVRQP